MLVQIRIRFILASTYAHQLEACQTTSDASGGGSDQRERGAVTHTEAWQQNVAVVVASRLHRLTAVDEDTDELKDH